ncbi:MAG TPA: hypothetical protein PLR17_05845 [Acetomicrobium flavidum]|uniref:Uncharacterized protein n=2 Tax=Acetomicrobium TaxID=49894 RepID=I4BWK7_ACEMN|nr:hypothetical protein Anamo_1039 [Acetomicrobium mobile DSM 13181]NLG94028.1 hypothetical protein [Acetomicrobium flavidum]SIN62018.1 hypothetical protein SAMN05444368_0065 [Acetomicrobium flavidum]HOJ82595.1 hypothetical protein [Acetomicrobium flavidum]HOM31518.1 hypothetical protein [Acetomicrobium flavidum]
MIGEGFFELLKKMTKFQATDYVKEELTALEETFALLLLGSFIGLPAPSAGLVIRLIPHLGPELELLERRVAESDDLFAKVAGILRI